MEVLVAQCMSPNSDLNLYFIGPNDHHVSCTDLSPSLGQWGTLRPLRWGSLRLQTHDFTLPFS